MTTRVMSFRVSVDSYDRLMGRYPVPSGHLLADVAAGQRAIDVGCAPGALTTELVRRVRATAVSAIEGADLDVRFDVTSNRTCPV